MTKTRSRASAAAQVIAVAVNNGYSLESKFSQLINELTSQNGGLNVTVGQFPEDSEELLIEGSALLIYDQGEISLGDALKQLSILSLPLG
jgi:hypothetical protein